jgi:hypothetical protein
MLERHGRAHHLEDETDRRLREIAAGRGGRVRFLEPSAADRGREPVRPIARRTAIATARRPRDPEATLRPARAPSRRLRSLAVALLVIACLSVGLGRLSWLVVRQAGTLAPASGAGLPGRTGTPPAATAWQAPSLCPGPGSRRPSAGLCP